MKSHWFLIGFAAALAVGCSSGNGSGPSNNGDPLGPSFDDPIWNSPGDGKEDSSAAAVVRQIAWDGFVYVPAGADDATALAAAKMQAKSALGAMLHSPQVSLRDRDARSAIDSSKFTRQPLQVVGPDGTVTANVDRVSYHYVDKALVPKTFTPSTFGVTMLFGDYVARAGDLRPMCSDDPNVDPDSLWFHYEPAMSACKSAIQDEATAINGGTATLPSGQPQIVQADADRRFLVVRASLTKLTEPPLVYPEYDRLFGFGTDRAKIVVYSFFGVDVDDQNPRDNGLVEDLRYVRTLRNALPALHVTETNPQAMLLDIYLNGAPLPGVTYENFAQWVIDGTGWPTGAANDSAKQTDLLNQVRDKFLERWIVWQLPVTASYKGETRDMTIELRTYWGREDGRTDWREAARNRYLEAFWYSDIFSYTGHSHFGHGPLEPVDYNGGNFPDRYQVMLFNSCVSYNYYDIDFLEMHPGQANNLDIVSNGLPAYWPGMGESTAKYILGLVAGKNMSWIDVLKSMRVNVSGLPSNYEPNRAVTGEEGNVFTTSQGQVTVQVVNTP